MPHAWLESVRLIAAAEFTASAALRSAGAVFFPGLRLVDCQVASVEVRPIEGGNRLLSLLGR